MSRLKDKFVTRAKFDRDILSLQRTVRKLIRRNSRLTTALVNRENFNKHYLIHRKKRWTNYARWVKKINAVSKFIAVFKKSYGVKYRPSLSNSKSDTRIVRLTQAEFHRLMYMIGSKRWKSLRR